MKIFTYPGLFFSQCEIFIIICHFYKVYYHTCSTWQNTALHEEVLESVLHLVERRGKCSNRELTAQGPHQEKLNKKQMEEDCKECSLSSHSYICSEILPQLAAAHPSPFFFLFISLAQTSSKWMKINKTDFNIVTTLLFSQLCLKTYRLQEKWLVAGREKIIRLLTSHLFSSVVYTKLVSKVNFTNISSYSSCHRLGSKNRIAKP